MVKNPSSFCEKLKLKFPFVHSFSLLCFIIFISLSCNKSLVYDVVVIGDGTGAISAGIQASRSGANTILLKTLPWLGGMLTSAGVSAIDGNHELPAGIWGEFRDSIYTQYGGPENVFTGWVSNTQFEPHIGNRIFQNMVAQEPNLALYDYSEIRNLTFENGKWKIVLLNSKEEIYTIVAKQIIDGTDLGDIAAIAGVNFDIGMEIQDEANELMGYDAPTVVQDLTYTAILEKMPCGKESIVQKSANYDPSIFYCSCEELCPNPKENTHPCDVMMSYALLPKQKYLINWPIHGNDYYTNILESNINEREKEFQKAKEKTLDFIHFIQVELGYDSFGLSKSEFPTHDLLPFMPYHREGRRIEGVVRFTSMHAKNPDEFTLFRTGIGVGNYPIDHHHRELTHIPDLDFPKIPSYALPIGALIPENVDNILIADKAISVSNIANGTTRLQPVILQVGQVAGLMAALAVLQECSPKHLIIREVQDSILAIGGYISPFKDLPKDHIAFKAAQRIAATGLIDLEERPYKWANETWLHPDSLIEKEEIINGINRFKNRGTHTLKGTNPYFTLTDFIDVLNFFEIKNISISELQKTLNILSQEGIPNVTLSRLEYVYLLDKFIDPFHLKDVNFEGEWITKINQI